jgi:outer membrane immunogenic protein
MLADVAYPLGGIMRRLQVALLAAVAVVGFASIATAADMPAKAPMYTTAPLAAPAYSWTGFYLGANVGGGWGSRNVSYTPNDPLMAFLFSQSGAATFGPPPASFDTSGVLGGLQAGYNQQFGTNYLIGIETDFNWSGMKGSGSTTGAGNFGAIPFTNMVDEKIKWFGTVRARLGYLPTNNLLFFISGGLAYGRVERTATYTFGWQGGGAIIGGPTGGYSFTCFALSPCLAGSSSNADIGWTMGGGVEYALSKNLTVKAEYLYVSLAGNTVTETALTPQSGTLPASFNANYSHTNFNVARVGLNYRF